MSKKNNGQQNENVEQNDGAEQVEAVEQDPNKTVVIVRRVKRTYGKNDNTQTLEHPHAIAPLHAAYGIAKRLNEQKATSRGKTSVSYAVNEELPHWESVEQYDEQVTEQLGEQRRETKRAALRKLSAEQRQLLGLPDPNATDEVIDAWQGANVEAAETADEGSEENAEAEADAEAVTA